MKKSKKQQVVVCLTITEAEGLLACADEGATGLLAEPWRAVKGYFSRPSQRTAAQRGLDKLIAALARAKEIQP